MKFSEKITLTLPLPQEEEPVSDQSRLEGALAARGYEPVQLTLPVLRSLYPLCRQGAFTLTLVWNRDHWLALEIEPGDTCAVHYGLAVDYGSTTVHMQLVDLNSGAVIATEKTENGQIPYGTDILTRITYALEGQRQKMDLQRATAQTFQHLLESLTESTGVDAAALPVMILSGNTTMIHFLLGLDAWTVFAAPFAPVTLDPGTFRGKDLGLDFDGLVYLIPAGSNYVGGDIISGLLTLDLGQREDITMFFDIGTNGELVLGNRHWLIAGAGAAGPALEGYISPSGMRAAPGAVDHIKITDDGLTYTTIENQKPRGICGSGIIDLLAQMRLAGWMDISGRLQPERSRRIVYRQELKEYVAVYATAQESATGEPLFFAQTDIFQYCETKAAAYTMIQCLLESVGCTKEDLARVHLSGAFPAHSDLESAIAIGMFPDLPRDRYSCTPNTSLDGARKLLLNRDLLEEVERLTGTMTCIQFASIPDFLVKMQAARFLPHTDLTQFPAIAQALNARTAKEELQ